MTAGHKRKHSESHRQSRASMIELGGGAGVDVADLEMLGKHAGA